MDFKKWNQIMDGIDDDLINESVDYKPKKRNYVSIIGGLAAAVILVVVGVNALNLVPENAKTVIATEAEITNTMESFDKDAAAVETYIQIPSVDSNIHSGVKEEWVTNESISANVVDSVEKNQSGLIEIPTGSTEYVTTLMYDGKLYRGDLIICSKVTYSELFSNLELMGEIKEIVPHGSEITSNLTIDQTGYEIGDKLYFASYNAGNGNELAIVCDRLYEDKQNSHINNFYRVIINVEEIDTNHMHK